jgi:D-alanine-D-alanine ligase
MPRRIAILFGGRSTEHEVSIQSARFIAQSLDRKKYLPVLIGIDKKGEWYLTNASALKQKTFTPSVKDKKICFPSGSNGCMRFLDGGIGKRIDVVFPVLHGSFGEDGTVQGLLELAGVPYVGAGVLGSALGMDKEVAKRLLSAQGIAVAKYLVCRNKETPSFQKVISALGTPFFLKPANAGSSVGVHKVRTKKEYQTFLTDAYRYDTKVILEEMIEGREIECAVLGGNPPKASLPGEIIVHHDFYSYEAKYLDEHGASLCIPARLSSTLTKKVQKIAAHVFQTLECEGLARVDFFVKKNGKLIVNEINTLPGFTTISMYPKLWEASGVPAGALTDRLIMLALERWGTKKKLMTTYSVD